MCFLWCSDVGDTVDKGELIGTVESTKAATDIDSPVTGEVLEINEKLVDTPTIMNTSPYVDGWMVKIKLANPIELKDYMNSDEYAVCVKNES